MDWIQIKKLVSFRNVYLLLLFVIAVSMPLSKFLASAAQIFLAATWLAEGRFDEKWRRIKMKPQILFFTLLFIVPLLAMTYTSDISYGMKELRVKIPLLMMPLVLGSIKQLNRRELMFILGGFVVAVIIGALISLSIMLGIGPLTYTSDRESVLFISHIRFALMVVLAIFILFYYAFQPMTPMRTHVALVLGGLGLILFLFMLKSLTGVVILVVGGWLLALRWSLKLSDMMLRWFLIVGLATIPVLVGFYLTDQISRFYTIHDSSEQLDLVTVKGNPYWHDTANPMIENGYHVGYYLCVTELKEAWTQVSELDYEGPDRRGQELKYTLIRYLTSMGLRKDAYGVSQLKPDDIELIENGFGNCLYKNPKRFRVRIYETIWEIDQYRHGDNPSGHSVTQRLEYLKTGWAIFKDQPIFGVGTGDTKIAFDQKYEQLKSPLDPVWRQRAHNQYLTFLLSFGIVGFILIFSAVLIPVVFEKRKNNFLILMFLLVSLMSMLNEDTLETQAGVVFFAFFYCLFVFADGSENQNYESIR
jgi:hypothetical protein